MRSTLIIVFAALVAVAYAQAPFTIVQSGNTTRYIVEPSTDFVVYERRSSNLAIWVPATASEVLYNVTISPFNSTTSACFDPSVRVSSGRDVGCFVASTDYSGSVIVPCNNIREFSVVEGEAELFDGVLANGGLEDIHYGSWWFFSTQQDTFDSDSTCVFDITIVVDNCPNGQVSVAKSGSTVCVTPIPLLGNNTFVRFNNTDTFVFVSNFASGVDSVTVNFNTTDIDATLSLWPGAPVRWADNSVCDFTTSSGANTVSCNSIPAGPFYIVVESSAGAEGGDNSIELQANVCQPGLGGINCASPVVAWNSTIPGGALPGDTGAQLPSHIFYVDFAVNSTETLNISVSVNNDNGSPRVVVKKDFWPFLDSARGFDFIFSGDDQSVFAADPVTIYFRPEDTYVGGRWYFAVVNEGASSVNYTFSSTSVVTSTGVTGVSSSSGVSASSGVSSSSGAVSSTSTGRVSSSSSTGAASTGASTGAASTGATTGTAATTGATTKSAASSVVVSAFLIVASVLALLL